MATRPGWKLCRLQWKSREEHEGTIVRSGITWGEVYYWDGTFKWSIKESRFFFSLNFEINLSPLVAYPCDISLHLPLTGSEETISWHGVSASHLVNNGDVGEEHDHHRNEKAEDEDGDDVGLVDGRVIGFGPVHLTGAITPIYKHI